MKNSVRLSGIAYESLVNGPGMRRVFFAQGCKHNCPCCFNPDTHSFCGGIERDIDELIKDALDNSILQGVTFSGGDPWEQADKFAYMAKAFKERGLNIWCYTGYTYEYIVKNMEGHKGWKELINNIDVLVDSRFEIDKIQDGLRFRGSTNQRIIDVKRSIKLNEVTTIEY